MALGVKCSGLRVGLFGFSFLVVLEAWLGIAIGSDGFGSHGLRLGWMFRASGLMLTYLNPKALNPIP